ncbi:MAG TPA: type II secretion system F family protein [Kineosporiaceae bacterium]|jgi:type IV pilus assembly protein PilC|nr:type II secretion system F family protein [Kineosporiaceae bacterium]
MAIATKPATKSYDYSVRDLQGKLLKGRTEAASEEAAVDKLRGQGLVPISVSEAGGGMNRELNISFGSGVGLKDLAVMSRQFATMISSGLSLLRALNILADQTDNKALAKVLNEVRTDVESGHSLSVALGKHPRIFPPLMVNMTHAGEVGGFLDGVLLQIAANFEAELKLRNKIKSAMTYPTVVFVIALLAVVGMLLFIVPVFSKMFSDLGGQLPAPTRVLVFLSNTMKTTAPFIVVLGIVFAAVWSRVKHREEVRRVLDPMKLRLPIFGLLFRKVAISRFTRNLGTMLSSGVPILQSLEIVGSASGNLVIRNAARDVEESVRKGEPLAKPLAQHKVFPPMVVQMIAVGEDTGAMDTMLGKISDFYDQEVEATAEALTSLIEPLMIAVLGGVIGAMIIALYMPIFSVFALIK